MRAVLLIVLLCASLPAMAQYNDSYRPLGFTPERATELQHRPNTIVDMQAAEELLRKIDTAIFGFTTMHARFRQTSNRDGNVALGEMWLMRPGKTRWEYFSPNSSQIFIHDGDLVYVDRELEQVTYADSPDTPMTLLLEEGASLFDERIAVVDLQQNSNQTRIVLVENRPDLDPFSMLQLVFDTKTMTLKRIHSTDATNLTTTISLEQVRFDIALDEKDFMFKDSRRISERKRIQQ